MTFVPWGTLNPSMRISSWPVTLLDMTGILGYSLSVSRIHLSRNFKRPRSAYGRLPWLFPTTPSISSYKTYIIISYLFNRISNLDNPLLFIVVASDIFVLLDQSALAWTLFWISGCVDRRCKQKEMLVATVSWPSNMKVFTSSRMSLRLSSALW